jgi:hypothetical protein
MISRKRLDTKPIVGTLVRGEEPVDLLVGGVSVVTFVMRPAVAGTGKSVTRPATVIQDTLFDGRMQSRGRVAFFPQALDFDTPAVYRYEWHVVFPDGNIETFPDGDFEDLMVLQDLSSLP